jgi:outer membrane protein OmpA-like peptidoglycan-associated protein/tetratricopeptide (TPR) repeat protein
LIGGGQSFFLVTFIDMLVRKVAILSYLLLLSFIGFGQGYDPEKVNPMATEIYGQGITYARNGEYTTAIKVLNDALQIEPKYVDAYLSLGGIYAQIKNYQESVSNFEKAFQIDSVYSNLFLLPYSISLAGTGQFERALQAVNGFLSNDKLNEVSVKAGEFRKKTYQFAVDYKKTHPVKNYVFNPINLGDSINTAGLEYFPSLTIDGKKLLFTTRVNRKETFYESDLINPNATEVNGKWGKARPLQGRINSDDNSQGAQNISQDGQWLIFTGCNYPEGLGSCDLYISHLTKRGWSEPENLGRNVNSEFWESSPSLSADKKDLYFSTDVPGGYGGRDIWVCHRGADGRWGLPRNLGAEINTAGNETCPFIHPDNQTLYFNSTGLPGYSEKPDLFVSRRQPDGSWGKPENLGYPINTIDDEGSLIVAANGKTAYYASDRYDTKGGLDIYTFELREDVRPLRTLWVKGKVFDAKTKNGLPSSVELADVSTRKVVSKIQTDEEGNYLTTLPVGKVYAFNVSRKGYLFYSENFDLSKRIPDSTYNIDIPLQPIEANARIVLKNVFFDTKKTELKPESIIELDNVARLMNENPNMRIQISGHTDNIGKPADNLKLSQDRATSVVKYLISKGIKSERMTFKGYGESKPIADNKTENGRALNRRTELSVISN